MNYWLVKSEPSVYSYDELVKDKSTCWEGVRNYAARNNLMAMKKGDLVLYYHSNEGKDIVGIAKVGKEHYPDPKDDKWVAIDLVPHKKMKKTIPLDEIKKDKLLKEMVLVKNSRLSVQSVKKEEFDHIINLGGL